MSLYKLIVDGVGIAYAGLNHRIALKKFKGCCDLSKGDDSAYHAFDQDCGTSRKDYSVCVGKSVTLWRDGEIFKEYSPPPDMAATLQPEKTTRYRPSNGSEGDWFMSQWCDRCIKDRPSRPCPIVSNAMGLDIDHADYPAEWVQTADGPRCTAFSRRHKKV